MLGHWSALAGAVQPPAWSGPVRVHQVSDHDPCPDLEPKRKPGPPKGTKLSPKGTRKPRAPRGKKQQRELQQLQRAAQAAVLQVLPAWSLIEPGSQREHLMQQAPAAWWWPKP